MKNRTTSDRSEVVLLALMGVFVAAGVLCMIGIIVT